MNFDILGMSEHRVNAYVFLAYPFAAEPQFVKISADALGLVVSWNKCHSNRGLAFEVPAGGVRECTQGHETLKTLAIGVPEST